MRTRKPKRRGAARQPDRGADIKSPNSIVAIFALAYLRLRAHERAAIAAARPNAANSLGNCLDDRRPVEASCEHVEDAAVNAAESRAEEAEQHDVELEAFC